MKNMEYSYKKTIKISGTPIGKGYPCYIIGEIGINHNGKIDIAKKLIDTAVNAGANAVKFQKRSLNDLYRTEVLENPNIESQGFEILLDVLKKVELSDSDYREIIIYCNEKNITFLCTPWDIKSLDFLESLDVPAYKIASADLTNFLLIKHISETKKPILVSTGMSTIEEIEKTVNFLKEKNSNFLILHTNSTYPAPVDSLNLSLIPSLEQKFQIPVGYSGHEQGIIPSVTSAILGAVVIERHITLDKTMDGMDQSSSLEPSEFVQLIKFIREAENSIGNPIKKMTRGEILQKEVLGKSLVSSCNIEEGEIFTENNIEVKGPAKGLSPQYFYEILGKKSNRSIKKGSYLQIDDL
jgi:N-acetylneuraminate synthase